MVCPVQGQQLDSMILFWMPSAQGIVWFYSVTVVAWPLEGGVLELGGIPRLVICGAGAWLSPDSGAQQDPGAAAPAGLGGIQRLRDELRDEFPSCPQPPAGSFSISAVVRCCPALSDPLSASSLCLGPPQPAKPVPIRFSLGYHVVPWPCSLKSLLLWFFHMRKSVCVSGRRRGCLDVFSVISMGMVCLSPLFVDARPPSPHALTPKSLS